MHVLCLYHITRTKFCSHAWSSHSFLWAQSTICYSYLYIYGLSTILQLLFDLVISLPFNKSFCKIRSYYRKLLLVNFRLPFNTLTKWTLIVQCSNSFWMPGWMGENCTDPCPSGYYGDACAFRCRCKNGGTCDRMTGSCSCAPGWKGPNCEVECNQGYYGESCNTTCECQHGGACNHVTGACSCTPGYQGRICGLLCEEGNVR